MKVASLVHFEFKMNLTVVKVTQCNVQSFISLTKWVLKFQITCFMGTAYEKVNLSKVDKFSYQIVLFFGIDVFYVDLKCNKLYTRVDNL